MIDNELRRCLYNERKQDGICTRCGKEDAVEGYNVCEECKTKQQARYKQWYANLKADKEGYEAYLKRYRDYNRIIAEEKNQKRNEKRKEIIENGQCIYCGRFLDIECAHKSCPECRVYHYNLKNNIIKKRKENRQCIHCGIELPSDIRWKSCEKCRKNIRDKKRSKSQ